MLLLSPFEEKHHRATAELARRRNEFVATVADKVCFIHVSPGGELEALRGLVRQQTKPYIELVTGEDIVKGPHHQ